MQGEKYGRTGYDMTCFCCGMQLNQVKYNIKLYFIWTVLFSGVLSMFYEVCLYRKVSVLSLAKTNALWHVLDISEETALTTLKFISIPLYCFWAGEVTEDIGTAFPRPWSTQTMNQYDSIETLTTADVHAFPDCWDYS